MNRLVVAVLSVAISGCAAVPLLKSTAGTVVQRSLLDRGGALTPLSTKLADARPYEPWIEIVDPPTRATPVELAVAIPAHLGAGYFHIKIKSFCLHAGAPASSQGNGYALAPYQGVRAAVLQHVVVRSALRPDIAQSDVQVLLWSIEYGAAMSELGNSPALALLDRQDMMSLSLDREGLQAFSRLTLGSNADRFGQGLRDPNMPFASLEVIAVPAAPAQNLGPSHWTFLGHGLFVRATSASYRETELELYRPQPYHVVRDASHRITSITVGDTKAVIQNDRIHGRSVAFTDLATGETVTVAASVLPHGSASIALFGFPDDRVSAKEIIERVKELHEKWEKLEDAFDEAKEVYDLAHQSDDPRAVDQRGKDALEEMETSQYMNELLSGSVGDIKKKGDVFKKHMSNLMDVSAYVICAMRGQCATGDAAAGDDGAAATADVAVPHNTGMQRLGLSNAAAP